MTAYEPGDVILVPVPFTDTSAVKQRPAVVVSGRRYNRHRPDLIVMPVTSNIAPPRRFGDFPTEDRLWSCRHSSRLDIPTASCSVSWAV